MKKENLKLFGHPYTVEYDDKWHDSVACAKFEGANLLIRIDGTMPESRQQEALLHEVLEAINYHLELELEHFKLTALSEAMYMAITDNNLFKKGKK